MARRQTPDRADDDNAAERAPKRIARWSITLDPAISTSESDDEWRREGNRRRRLELEKRAHLGLTLPEALQLWTMLIEANQATFDQNLLPEADAAECAQNANMAMDPLIDRLEHGTLRGMLINENGAEQPVNRHLWRSLARHGRINRDNSELTSADGLIQAVRIFPAEPARSTKNTGTGRLEMATPSEMKSALLAKSGCILRLEDELTRVKDELAKSGKTTTGPELSTVYGDPEIEARRDGRGLHRGSSYRRRKAGA
jgi:hypothetical protein